MIDPGLAEVTGYANIEPVRYETNTEPHQHFRCRLCLRLFDVTRGLEMPGEYVGGAERRLALCELERS